MLPRQRGLGRVFQHAGKQLVAIQQTLSTWPGLTGLGVGFLLPKLLSTTATIVTAAAIGVGGYAAPQGSWLRRFSIGAGLGASLHTAINYAPNIARAAEAAGKVYTAGKILSSYEWWRWIPVAGPFLNTLFPKPYL